MNAFILYLEDDLDNGVKVSAEVIGDPEKSLEFGEKVLVSLLSHPKIRLDKKSVFIQDPPTERIQ